MGNCAFRRIKERTIGVPVFITFGGINKSVSIFRNEGKPLFWFPRRSAGCHRKSRCPVPFAHVSGEMLRPCGSGQASRRSRRRNDLGSVLDTGKASRLGSIFLRLRHSRGSRPCWIARGRPSLMGAIDTAGLIPIRAGQTFICPTPFSRTQSPSGDRE